MIILWLLLGALGVLLILLLIALLRTLRAPKLRSTYVPAPDEQEALALADKLAKMVRVDTVSVPETDQREKFLTCCFTGAASPRSARWC